MHVLLLCLIVAKLRRITVALYACMHGRAKIVMLVAIVIQCIATMNPIHVIG